MLHQVWECIQTLVHNGVAYTEIEFRMRDPAIVFFFKRPTHTTTDLLSYLCSSLLDHKEEAAPSWRRFESLLRQRVTYKDLKPDFVPGPVLLILDGLSQEERAEMRRVVLMFAGKVRVIMVVDTNSVLQSALSVDRSHNQQRDTQVVQFSTHCQIGADGVRLGSLPRLEFARRHGKKGPGDRVGERLTRVAGGRCWWCRRWPWTSALRSWGA